VARDGLEDLCGRLLPVGKERVAGQSWRRCLTEANPQTQRAIPAIIAPMIARRDVAVGSAFRPGSPKVTLVSAFLTVRRHAAPVPATRALVIKSGSSLNEESGSGRFRCACQSYGFF
jgi:hypothetical protein